MPLPQQQQKPWPEIDIQSMLSPSLSGYSAAVKQFSSPQVAQQTPPQPVAPAPPATPEKSFPALPPEMQAGKVDATRPRKATTDQSADGRPRQVSKTFRSEGLGSVGQMRAEQQAIGEQGPNDQTVKTPYGYENQPGKKPSKGWGALYGAAAGWQEARAHGADAKSALAGAGTGAGVGLIQPRVIKALEMKNAQAKLQGKIDQELQNQKGIAQIQDIQAQAQQREQMKAQGIEYKTDINGNIVALPKTTQDGVIGPAQAVMGADGKTPLKAQTKPKSVKTAKVGRFQFELGEDGKWKQSVDENGQPLEDKTKADLIQVQASDGKEYPLSGKAAFDYANGKEVEVAPGVTVKLTPGQLAQFEGKQAEVKAAEITATAESNLAKSDETDALKRSKEASEEAEKARQEFNKLKNIKPKIQMIGPDGKPATNPMSGAPIMVDNPEYKAGDIEDAKDRVRKAESVQSEAQRDARDAARQKLKGSATAAGKSSQLRPQHSTKGKVSIEKAMKAHPNLTREQVIQGIKAQQYEPY